VVAKASATRNEGIEGERTGPNGIGGTKPKLESQRTHFGIVNVHWIDMVEGATPSRRQPRIHWRTKECITSTLCMWSCHGSWFRRCICLVSGDASALCPEMYLPCVRRCICHGSGDAFVAVPVMHLSRFRRCICRGSGDASALCPEMHLSRFRKCICRGSGNASVAVPVTHLSRFR